ncbi:hypothetical protein HDK64DRAFT_105256 [Phyllosticta capitalensis]
MSARCRCRSKVRDRSVLFPRSLPQSSATAFSSRRCVCLLVSASKVEQSQVEQASMSAFFLFVVVFTLSRMYFVFSQNFARRGESETFFFFFFVGGSVFFSSCRLLSRVFSLFSIRPSKRRLYDPPPCPSSSSSSSSSCVFFGWQRWILYTKGQLRGSARCGGVSRVGRSGCGCGYWERWKPTGVPHGGMLLLPEVRDSTLGRKRRQVDQPAVYVE